jgi:hypothetical protein
MKRPKRYNQSQALAILKDAIVAAGSLRKFAASTDAHLSATFIGEVIKGEKPISERLAGEIGLRRVTEFEVRNETETL